MRGSRHSLTTLRVLMAAGRHLNFSRAAEDLNLTQSAVSKHVQSLEERLGTPLFKRTPTGLRVTHAGAVYLERITIALRLIDEADAVVSHPGARVHLDLAVSPSFAQWALIPRLHEFFTRHPDVRINVRPRLVSGRVKGERFDAEIQLNTGHASDMSAIYLCGREMGLVASPALLARQPLERIADLNRLTVLKRAQRGYDWSEWKAVAAPSWEGPGPEAPEFEGFSVLIPAVLHGLGAAIVPLCLMQDHLSAGRLVRPLRERVEGRYGYHLMLPRPTRPSEPLKVFSDWLVDMSQRLEPPSHV